MNYCGRVLDGCPATAEVLEDIVSAVKGAEFYRHKKRRQL